MLASLFPVAHERHAASPVGAWLIGFAEWLLEVGYGRQPARVHVRRLREVLESQVPAVPADAVFSVEGLAALFVARLRAFLRYCFVRGLIAEHLDQIDTPRTYRDELPPRGTSRWC